jgi:enoyl-CoA hydratase/carnithine racemase
MSDILHETRGAIAWTTLNRPESRNAMTFAMYEGLVEQAARVTAEGAIRAWVITGAGGKAFAAGTDISQFKAFTSGQDGLDYEKRIDRVLSAIEDCPKPVIAAIAGACTGGGLGIAAVCDLRIASANARFGVPVARTLGNCLSTANVARLAALIGAGRLKEMIFTARLMAAPEALEAGLISEILPTPEAVAERAMALAEIVAGMAPRTLTATKFALKRLRLASGTIQGDDLVEMCFGSRDFREGMDAFLAKRAPHWTGE